MVTLKAQAIQTALVGEWNNAITLNQLILQEEPNDIDTLNRLAFAYLSSGNAEEAKAVYEKVLMLDMKNPIAIRNLKRLHDYNSKKAPIMINNLFIEEPGKTKVVELINVTEKKVLVLLRSGEKLELKVKRSKIFAYDTDDQFIGMLPDDIGQRLIKFITEGNEYEAYVRTTDNGKVIIFLRETKRIAKYKNQPSFINNYEKQKLSVAHARAKNQLKSESLSDAS